MAQPGKVRLFWQAHLKINLLSPDACYKSFAHVHPAERLPVSCEMFPASLARSCDLLDAQQSL